jgi:hypothetical protein
MKKVMTLSILLLIFSLPLAWAGLISRQGGNFTTHDELADLDKINTQLNDIFEWTTDVDYENIADEGIRNADLDSDEVFSQESWNNVLKSGHFPVWSGGVNSTPDDWTDEGTPTIAQDTRATGAPPSFYSVQITATGAGLEGIKQTVDVRANQTYSVMLKVKVTSGDIARVVVDDDGSMAEIAHDYSDTDWQTENNKKYFSFTTASDSTQVTIKLLAKNDTDIVWFSEVQITEGRLMKGYQYQSTDANTVNGIYASATPEANKLLALDANAEFPADVVTTNTLKTASGTVQNGGGSSNNYTLPGGAYGFYPQFKSSTGTQTVSANLLYTDKITQSYVTYIGLTGNATGPETIYAQQTYVTASGEDYYIYLLYDKNKQQIIGGYSAPDPPWYGSGDDETKVPHPFVDYWNKPLPSNLEIILIEKNKAKEIQKKAKTDKKKRSPVDIIKEDYKLGSIVPYRKDLDIANYQGQHRKLQFLHKDIKYRTLIKKGAVQ